MIVPDQAPTIQGAIDAGVDTILIRPGQYPETPIVSQPLTVMGAQGPDARPLLSGLRLHIDRPQVVPALYSFQSLAISGPVVVDNDRGLCDIAFADCSLLAGAADSSSVLDTGDITFLRSRLDGIVSLFARGWIRLDSCHVTGQLGISGAPLLAVTRCLFEGAGAGDGIVVRDEINGAEIVDNVIRSYVFGARIIADGATIAGNRVEDCLAVGIAVDAPTAIVEGNTVERCGTGLIVGSVGCVVRGNTVVAAGQNGIEIVAEFPNIDANVVWGCGGDGIAVRPAAASAEIKVSGNTSCRNAGSGLFWNGLSHVPAINEWVGNIGWENGEFGVRWWAADSGRFACNDWFGNQLGALEGRPPASGDYFVEPMFCNPDSGDFRVDSASPLLEAAGCGQIGALGVGCGKTGTLVQRFTARRVSDGVEVVWEVAKGATASEIWVERSEGASGQSWTQPVTERWTEGRAVVELDRSALADRTYRYRLVGLEGSVATVLDPGRLVEPQARVKFGLVDVGPSPGKGAVRIGFALERAGMVEIGIYDVRGRIVAFAWRGVWEAGSHVVEWNGRTRSGEPAPAGVYVVRYVHPGGQDWRSVVRLQ